MSFPPVIKRLNELDIALGNNGTALTTHANNKNNPHAVTAAQVGAYSRTEIDGMLGDLGGGLTTRELITTSGTWTAPKTGTYIFILVGAGGASGGLIGAGSTQASGGGGGGGVLRVPLWLTAGQSISLVVGASGPGEMSASIQGGGFTSIEINSVLYIAPGGGAGATGRLSATTGARHNGAGGGAAGLGTDIATAKGNPSSGDSGFPSGGGGGGALQGLGAQSGVAGPDGGDSFCAEGGKGAANGTTPGAGGRSRHVLGGTYGRGGDGISASSQAAGKAGSPGCIGICY